ncbi:MAG: hypothetical protein K2M67_02670 [Muribaculaceae bacterium]|nr:hypothetical protein [Bacteroides sp.]MDE7495731.1 hypothetical protein [Muribaculaceae bacterium]
MTLDEIKSSIQQGKDAEVCIRMLTEYIAVNPESDEAYYLRGVRYWSLGRRSLAINDYLAAIRINPNSKATMAMKTSYEILNFYNKDIFNP